MFKILHHYFFPHLRNNHRSKILHNSSLLVIIVFLLFSTWFSIIVNSINPQILGINYSISDQELLVLVNQKRLENGLSPLILNGALSSAAYRKARHMLDNNYWAHFAPDGTSPWNFIISSGYNYVYAGENLAKGFVNANDAVEAWMNSPKHRDNILSSQYRDVGFAIVEGTLQGEETVLIVELFGQEKNSFLASNTTDVETALSVSDRREQEQAQVQARGQEEEASVSANEIAQVPLLGSTSIDNLESVDNFQSKLYQSQPLVDIISSTKTFSFVLTAILLVAFILDLVVVVKRKIPRIVGDNLDHILLLSIFIVFIFIYNLGAIL